MTSGIKTRVVEEKTSRYTVAPPLALLAELTHRCPLSCLYCYNPLELTKRDQELSTEDWKRVLRQAAEIGVLQVHFSGGEPLLRPDLLELIEEASRLELFSNLITSGIGLTDKRLAELDAAELGSFQLSFQGADATTAKNVAGGDFLKKKLEVAHKVRDSEIPFSINVVLHRQNLHQVGDLIDLAHDVGGTRLELANTQYYGWGLLNRAQLIPTREQLERAEAVVHERRERYPEMEIIWVIPDYYADTPKPCMGGWGAVQLTVSPSGQALPCPGAYILPEIYSPSVKEHDLGWIWYESPAFNRFRGLDWLPEPCQSCPKKTEDFGGCRCQAFLLTGDATKTDPVCILSPDHHIIEAARDEAVALPLAPKQYRVIR